MGVLSQVEDNDYSKKKKKKVVSYCLKIYIGRAQRKHDILVLKKLGKFCFVVPEFMRGLIIKYLDPYISYLYKKWMRILFRKYVDIFLSSFQKWIIMVT